MRSGVQGAGGSGSRWCCLPRSNKTVRRTRAGFFSATTWTHFYMFACYTPCTWSTRKVLAGGVAILHAGMQHPSGRSCTSCASSHRGIRVSKAGTVCTMPAHMNSMPSPHCQFIRDHPSALCVKGCLARISCTQRPRMRQAHALAGQTGRGERLVKVQLPVRPLA